MLKFEKVSKSFICIIAYIINSIFIVKEQFTVVTNKAGKIASLIGSAKYINLHRRKK